MTTRQRDSQRSALYDAEDELMTVLSRGGTIDHFGSIFTVPEERKFGDVDSIGPYLDKVLAYAPIARLPHAAVEVRVRERRGITKAHYEHATHTIAIPPYRVGDRARQGWALRECVVLHELAHHLAGPCPDSGAHGPVFVAHLLYLTEHVIAPEAAHLLRVACWERGVAIGETP